MRQVPDDQYVLLDANIIIELHELGVWERLPSRVVLVVPSVVWQEARFYDSY
jgi:hypothetical protein